MTPQTTEANFDMKGSSRRWGGNLESGGRKEEEGEGTGGIN